MAPGEGNLKKLMRADIGPARAEAWVYETIHPFALCPPEAAGLSYNAKSGKVVGSSTFHCAEVVLLVEHKLTGVPNLTHNSSSHRIFRCLYLVLLRYYCWMRPY